MDDSTNQNPMFARARNNERDTTELRVEIPKFVMGVIDAHWMSRGTAKASRTQMVNEILLDWAERKWQEASLVMRLAPDKPDPNQADDV